MNEPMSAPTVLLVEPDGLVRTPLASYLRDCGYTVVEASDGNEALALLQRESPVDLVLAAIDLGGDPNGFALAQWVRANLPGVKVLLAGSVEKAAGVAAELCDQGPHLNRPYEPQAVVDRIKRLLASRGSDQGGALMSRPSSHAAVVNMNRSAEWIRRG